MRYQKLFLVLLLLVLDLTQSALSTRKYYDTNEKLSADIRKKLSIEVLSWDYGENPIMEFSIDKEGKVSNLDFVKKRNKYNSQVCANELITMEPFAQEFREQTHVFECRPETELSRKDFKDLKKYIEKYFQEMNAKISANWFPDPRKYKLKALTSFDLYKDGHVENFKFLNSSNDEEFDKLAKKAIEMSSPFSTLQERAFTFYRDKEKINIIYDFDNSINYQNQLNRSVGFGVGSFGPGVGFGLGYGSGSMRNRRWGGPFYGGYPYGW
jgi:hypothetical protein